MDDIALIKKTFEHKMDLEAISVQRMDNVLNNRVFRIETESGPYIFKAYASRDWPEDGKLPFIDQRLSAYRITHARLYAFDRQNDDFPNGYMIEECLPGITADRLSLSYEENIRLYEKLAAYMSRVHQITLKNFGYTGSGVGLWATFSAYIYDIFNDATAALRNQSRMDAAMLYAIREYLYGRLKECDRYPSVICHGDLSAKNILVHSDEIALIDWDDAQSLCWMADIARLTLWMRLSYDRRSADAYRRAFLDCYETQYDKSAFNALECVLHVWYGLDYLNFSAATPNYHHQYKAVEALLAEALTKCEGLKSYCK